MKKIFTLFTIFVGAACLYATPTTRVSTNKAVALKQLMQKERMATMLQEQDIVDHSRNQQIALTTSSVLPEHTSYTLAPKAKAEALDTVELYFDSFYDDPYYTPIEVFENRQGEMDTTGGDWYIVLNNERYQFIFDIFGGEPNDPSGNYTEEDLDIWFSWAAIPAANGKTSYYKSCDLTVKATKVSNNLTKYSLEATIVTTLGIGGEVNGAFKIHAEHQTITPVQKLDVAILNCQVTPEEDRFRFAGKNDTIEVDMMLFSDFGIEGYYSHKSIDPEETKIVYRGKSHEVMEMEGVIYAAEMKTGGMAYVFMTEILTTDTIFFNIAMEAPVIPTDTVNITCKNMVIDDSYGFTDATILITASNKEYSIMAGLNDQTISAPSLYTGEKAMVYLTDIRNDKEIPSMQCSIEIDEDEDNGYIVYIEMLGQDHKYYTMDLKWDIPTPVRTVTLDFPTTAKALYYIDDLGLEEVQLANYTDEYSVAFDILHIDQVMGEEFTEANLWMEQGATFIVHHTEEYDVNIDLATVEGKVWQSKDTTYLTATAIGFDSVKYVVSMFYAVPKPVSTVTNTFEGDQATFTNALPQGIFILEGVSKDEKLMAKVQVRGLDGSTIEGTYINDGVFTQNDFAADNTYVSVYNSTTKKYDEYALMKGTMTVTVDEQNIITAVADFICEDAKQYNLTFKISYTRPHLPYDTEEGALDYTYPSDSYATVTDWIDGYGMIHLELIPSDYSNVCAIYFNADSMDAKIGIPQGVYPINNSYEAGTVVASKGIAMNGAPLEAFICSLIESEDGYFYGDPLYCMVDGTITIENANGNLKVEVDAVNSYDVPVKLHYLGPIITGVEDIQTGGNVGVEKRIIDGQLIIVRNGEEYSVTGQQLK